MDSKLVFVAVDCWESVVPCYITIPRVLEFGQMSITRLAFAISGGSQHVMRRG